MVLEALDTFFAAFLADLLELRLQAYQLLVKCIIYFLVPLTLQRDILHLVLLALDSDDELANVSFETAYNPT